MMPAPLPRFEPMTVGMILDTTFRLYLHNAGLLLGITALVHVPYFVLLVGFTIWLQQEDEPGILSFSAYILGLACLKVFVAYTLSQGAVTYAISERYLQRQPTAGEALHAAWQRYGTLLWSMLMVSLIVSLGLFLLIVPGILWTLSYTLVVPIVVLETYNAAQSRQRSWFLVEGARGKVFAVLITFWGLSFLVAFGLQSVMLFLLPGDAHVLGSLIEEVVSLLLTPFALIAAVLLYYDLRIRKEGFDLEMLSQAMSR